MTNLKEIILKYSCVVLSAQNTKALNIHTSPVPRLKDLEEINLLLSLSYKDNK